MRAITLIPGVTDSTRLDDIPEPPPSDGAILVRALALGVCGTDREIVSGHFGEAPPGAERLVLGHESLGEVIEAPEDSGFAKGDRIVGIVRRPDPVPCQACRPARACSWRAASGWSTLCDAGTARRRREAVQPADRAVQ